LGEASKFLKKEMTMSVQKKLFALELAKGFFADCQRVRCAAYMRDQLLRAALSVVNNLSEGSAKPSVRERARYYAIALGSFRECQGMLELLEQNALLKGHDLLGVCLYRLHRGTLRTKSL
jgi:four helix bundle protein